MARSALALMVLLLVVMATCVSAVAMTKEEVAINFAQTAEMRKVVYRLDASVTKARLEATLSALDTMLSAEKPEISAATATLTTADTSASSDELALRWVHIDKCGSSFAASLYWFGCLPAVARTANEYLLSSHGEKRTWHVEWTLSKWPFDEKCLNAADRPLGRRVLGPDPADRGTTHHRALAPDRGHIVTMVRNPEQRMLSAHVYFGGKNTDRGHQAGFLRAGSKNATQNVMQAEIVPFIGVVERWNASVALFHCRLMGGEPIHSTELYNLHPSPGKSHAGSSEFTATPPGWYDRAAHGFTAGAVRDPVDEELYEAVLSRMASELRTHRACVCSFGIEFYMMTQFGVVPDDMVQCANFSIQVGGYIDRQ